MQFLYLLEKIRNPVFDFIFSTLTYLGDETVFLLLSIFIFWCVDKKRGYFILISGFFGTIINQVCKLTFKIPRPWVIDSEFTIVESAREAATGYSFPSGHTQNAVSTFGAVYSTSKKKWVRGLALAAAITVPFTRMYLGVHTPWDVLAAAATAIILLIVLYPLFEDEDMFERAMPYVCAAIVFVSFVFFVYAMFIGNPNANQNTYSAAKNACTLLGCSLALIPVYFIDRRYTDFKTDGKWYAQLFKLVIGLAVVFVIKTFVKIPLEALMGPLYERALRYFLIVIFAGAVWPLTFAWFSKLDIPALNRFGERVKAIFTKKSAEEEI